ncbi:adenylate/guanylate cyclase domain-containing protein [Cupriavidus basilensis]
MTEFADERGLEKIKTIGDAYMAAAGLPEPVNDHAVRAAHMALDMLQALDEFNERNGYALKMRIGMNSGPVVAGVIGRRRFIYDLWGNAVNVASRMESGGSPGRVQLTETTRLKTRGSRSSFEERGLIGAKGIGSMSTWLLAEEAAAHRLVASQSQ